MNSIESSIPSTCCCPCEIYRKLLPAFDIYIHSRQIQGELYDGIQGEWRRPEHFSAPTASVCSAGPLFNASRFSLSHTPTMQSLQARRPPSGCTLQSHSQATSRLHFFSIVFFIFSASSAFFSIASASRRCTHPTPFTVKFPRTAVLISSLQVLQQMDVFLDLVLSKSCTHLMLPRLLK